MQENDRINHVLAENVTRLRQEQQLTKSSLALMSGISRLTLNKVEKGASNVRLSNLQKMADALCVDPADLLDTSSNSQRGL